MLVRHTRMAAPAAALLALCGGGSAHAVPRAPFDYDRGAALGLREHGIVNPGYPIRVHDVSYASPRGGRVTAYLVVPPGRGRHPAVIYLHGAGGNRFQMLGPATQMAARGAVGLTIDSPFARTPRPRFPSGLAGVRKERDLLVQTVVDLRRAVDVLQSLPSVDGRRVAFVGWSAGARSGAVLAGVDHRIRAFDLMSAGAAPLTDYKVSAPRLRSKIIRILRDADPLRYVAEAAPGTLFFQDGRRDEIVPRAALRAMIRAAPSPKRVRWYPAGHRLGGRAYRDQLVWLSQRLGLRG